MREIKFRAWYKPEKKMYHYVEHTTYGDGSSGVTYLSYSTHALTSISDDDVELMQYIGLKDKNGKEIYEGDIVKNITHGFNGMTFFENGCFWVREYKTHVDEGLYGDREKETRWSINLEWEIIGNVYEDPELFHE